MKYSPSLPIRGRQLGAGALVLLFGLAGWFWESPPAESREREVTIRARKYAYQPAVLRVNRGDLVRLRFVSEDVVHGFYLEGYDLDVHIFPLEERVALRRPARGEKVEWVEEVSFVAGRAGKFRYRCSQTCGFMHPFMLGELIVEPNRLLPAGVGLAVGFLVGGFLLTVSRREDDDTNTGEPDGA